MSSMNVVAGELIFGCRSRLIAYAKFAAVTAVPSANLYVFFSVKVYVFPSRETAGSEAATSGTIRVPPADASLSGKFSSLHVVEYSTCHECEKYASAGSMKSKSLRRVETKRAADRAVLAGLRRVARSRRRKARGDE